MYNVTIGEGEKVVFDQQTGQSYPIRHGANISEEGIFTGSITFPNLEPEHFACFLFHNDKWIDDRAKCMPSTGWCVYSCTINAKLWPFYPRLKKKKETTTK